MLFGNGRFIDLVGETRWDLKGQGSNYVIIMFEMQCRLPSGVWVHVCLPCHSMQSKSTGWTVL